MAKSTSFAVKQGSKVTIGTEVTMGTATLAAGVTCEMPVTDYSFSELGGHTLEAAPFRMGLGGSTQSDDMVRPRRHDRMFEVSLTFHATARAIDRVCLALFGDGTTPNALLGNMPAATTYKHGVASIVPVTLHFEDATHAGVGTDMIFKSCMCTNFTLSGDISSNGGVVMGTVTFVTAYNPTQAALTFSGGTHTTVSDHQVMFNMHDLDTTTFTESGGSSRDILLYGFELSIARTVNRIGFDPDNNFDPAGYVVGGYEVTGSLTMKRDAQSLEVITYADTAEPLGALDLDTTVFQISAAKVLIDTPSINFDDDGFKQVVPFRCVYSGATTSTIVSIGTAAEDSYNETIQ